jgi:hypothetical protein
MRPIWPLLLLLAVAQLCAAAVLSKSELETCLNDGTDEVACASKLTLLLSLPAGSGSGDTISATLASVEDASGAEQNLVSEMSVSCTLGDVVLSHSLTFLTVVNAAPYETYTVHTAVAVTPTFCGVKYFANGSAIPGSEGFLCDITGGVLRGVDEVTLLTQQSEHCLNMSDLWYGVFEVSDASLDYELTCTVSSSDAGETAISERVLVLSPSFPTDTTADGSAYAAIVGSFSSTALPRALAGKYLLAPMLPTTHTRVLEGPDAWLVLSSTLVDTTGATCDMPGVSYATFASQTNGCIGDVGDCLRNQPEDYRALDDAAVAAGDRPSYFLEAYGDLVTDGDITPGTNGFTVRLSAPGLSSALVQLVLAADDIVVTSNVSPAIILSASVEDYEALATSSQLHVICQNEGSIAADYVLAIPACSAGVITPAAETSSIFAGATYTFDLDISSTSVLSEEQSCLITLKHAATGVTADELTVFFTPQATDLTAANDGIAATGTSLNAALSVQGCLAACGYLDPFCLIRNNCRLVVAAQCGAAAVALTIGVKIYNLPALKWARGKRRAARRRRRHSKRRASISKARQEYERVAARAHGDRAAAEAADAALLPRAAGRGAGLDADADGYASDAYASDASEYPVKPPVFCAPFSLKHLMSLFLSMRNFISTPELNPGAPPPALMVFRVFDAYDVAPVLPAAVQSRLPPQLVVRGVVTCDRDTLLAMDPVEAADTEALHDTFETTTFRFTPYPRAVSGALERAGLRTVPGEFQLAGLPHNGFSLDGMYSRQPPGYLINP